MRKIFILIAFAFSILSCHAQDDLMSMLNSENSETTDYTKATFKSDRIVIGQSVEIPAPGDVMLIITHHFGALNSGYENLFGLKQAAIRIGDDIGITRWLGANIGINTDKNTIDGALKFKILRQKTGKKNMPVTLDFYTNMAVFTTKWENPERENYFSSRLSYACQILVARKFGNNLSLQLTPSYVHKNLVPSYQDKNDIFTLGAGGRFKLTQRFSINAEYHHLFKGQVVSTDAYDSFSIGMDIETGGHVFQIFLTNSFGEYEQSFLTDTRGKWSNGGIFLGFNITRTFTLFAKH